MRFQRIVTGYTIGFVIALKMIKVMHPSAAFDILKARALVHAYCKPYRTGIRIAAQLRLLIGHQGLRSSCESIGCMVTTSGAPCPLRRLVARVRKDALLEGWAPVSVR